MHGGLDVKRLTIQKSFEGEERSKNIFDIKK